MHAQTEHFSESQHGMRTLFTDMPAGVQDVQVTAGLKLQQAAESMSAASAKLDRSLDGEAPSLQAALALSDAVSALQESLAAEAMAALFSLRQQAGKPHIDIPSPFHPCSNIHF